MSNLVVWLSLASTVFAHGSGEAGEVTAPLSSGQAIGFTFFSAFATVIGASIPVLVLLYRSRKERLVRSDEEVERLERGVDAGTLNTAAPTASSNMLSDLFVAGSLGFAAGALIFGSLFDILPTSVTHFTNIAAVGEKYANLVSLCSLALGIVIFILLERLINYIAPDNSCPCHVSRICKCSDPSSCGCPFKTAKSMSLMTLLAMTLHHIPEGLVTYLAITTDFQSGIIVGLVLIVHVFPEGVAVGVTALEAYPDQKWRGPVYGLIAGYTLILLTNKRLAQPLGALIGFLGFSEGRVPSEACLGVIYGVIVGMLVVISVRGLLPYARKIDEDDRVTSTAVLSGGAVIFFSIAMFGVAGFNG